MKVIFIQNVAKIGKINEIKEVADSYAMNVLIPKKYAVIATSQAIKKIEDNKNNKEFKKVLDKNLFLKAINDLQDILNKESLGKLEIFGHKADEKGNLFSQIRDTDIVDAIYNKIKLSLNSNQIIMPKDAIKSFGEYEIELKDRENKKKLKIIVK